ncbi:MAG: endonuclease III [Bacilli bacterium]|jgi:endonuclease-3
MANKEKISNYLDELYPNARCELNYHSLFELLIAVILSAQTTDIAVNKVTKELFEKYPSPELLAMAKQEEVEQIIKPIGLYKNKTKNIIATAKVLTNNYDNVVPNSLEELTKLPGVGRKTASVVLVEGFKLPAFPVDTHVARVSKRLNLVQENDSILIIEQKLKKLFNKKSWGKIHHQLIHFGRYFCKARNPNCQACKLQDDCKYFTKN